LGVGVVGCCSVGGEGVVPLGCSGSGEAADYKDHFQDVGCTVQVVGAVSTVPEEAGRTEDGTEV